MIVGVIGSGSIGPDLAYGFVSALARVEGARVYADGHQEGRPGCPAWSASRGTWPRPSPKGKLDPKSAKAIETALVPTLELKDLGPVRVRLGSGLRGPARSSRRFLRNLEGVVGKECLIGFATSGIPRARIAPRRSTPSAAS